MAVDPRTSPPPQIPATDGIVCPFCAHVRGVKDADSACPKCTMEDSVGTRRSTGERIGPWFVLQRKNPTAPGLKFSVLLTLARRGHVTAKSIVRGPTTGQLWRFASEVKGLSRLFGICWHCKASVSPDATTCPKCKSAQEIPDDPDVFLESHLALPLMRELPGNGFSSGEPIAAASNGENLPAPMSMAGRRDREPRRPAQPGGLDDLADLTRALAIQRPAEPERLPRRLGANELRQINTEGGEPILSASDLATAFQLGGPRPGVFVRARRATWTLIKVGFVLAIVLSLAAIAIGYMRPSWKQVALDRAKPYLDRAGVWWNDAYTAVGGDSNSSSKPDERPTEIVSEPRVADGGNSAAVPPATPITLDEGKSATKIDREQDRSPSVVDATPANAEKPIPRAPAVTPTTKPVTAKIEPDPKPPEVAKADPPRESPKVETPKVESPPSTGTRELTLDEAIAQATELRNSALDAEARKDWRAAVVIYDQIGKLPEEARPSDLKVRLALARERMGK